MLIRERLGRFANLAYRTKHALEASGVWVPLNHNVVAVLKSEFEKPQLILAHNIVTNAGDTYYAQKKVGETPDNAFDSLYLSSVDWTTTPAKAHTSDDIASMISGAETTVESNYPKTNDTDPDNTGGAVDVGTWKFRFAKADFNDTDIDAGAIALPGVTTWGASSADPLLTAFDFTAFGKTSDQALVVFINHEQLGV